MTLASAEDVYVRLLGLPCEQWRIVAAQRLGDDHYLLQGEVPAGERWEFQPGERVWVEECVLTLGGYGLLAVARMDTPEVPAQAAHSTKEKAMQELKHSGLGIASFVSSIAAAVLIFIMVMAAGFMELSTPGGIDEESAEALLIGLLLFTFMGLTLVAFGLGVGGLFQAQRKKVFAVLGTVFSVLVLLGTGLLLLMGMAMD